MTNVIDFNVAKTRHNPNLYVYAGEDTAHGWIYKNCNGGKIEITGCDWGDIYVNGNPSNLVNPYDPPEGEDFDEFYYANPELLPKAEEWDRARTLEFVPKMAVWTSAPFQIVA